MSDEPMKPDASAGDEWSDESSYQDEELEPTFTADAEAVAEDEWTDVSMTLEEELGSEASVSTAGPTTREALAWLTPLRRRLLSSWRRLLTGIRNRIPAAVNLSDLALSAIVIGILVVLLAIANSLRQPSAVMAQAPSDSAVETTSSPKTLSPDPADSQSRKASALTEEDTAIAPAGVESDRIALLQSRLTDSSIFNAQRVIDSIQADFTHNRLMLTFNNDWYRLSDYDQTQLAQALMGEAVELSFPDLEFRSLSGELIGRSPVVGKEMVIYLRERPPEVDPPERPRYRLTIDR